MSDEPLYCTQCGREYGCDHSDDDGHGPWCEICGIKHVDDRECPFYCDDPTPCAPKEEWRPL